ncbi:MAG: SUMF1/EgtB/PvdO family nonheme iron enzyme [Polyangiales bacterium]
MRARLLPLVAAVVAALSVVACDAIVGIRDVTLGTDAGGDTSAPADAGAPYPWPAGAVTMSPGCGVLARPGPKMVRVDDPTHPFCIDTTELTLSQWEVYRNGVLALAKPPPVPDFCDDFVERETPPWSDDPTSSEPRAHTNWCHAKRYCAWAGKRLCGKRGGGKLETFDDRSSELNFACGNGVGSTFPYGTSYDVAKCNTESTRVVDVASRKECHGPAAPYDAIFDLVGNVAEWEDACEVGLDGKMECSYRGGSFASSLERLPCASNDQAVVETDHPGIGIRCCADAE